jgi:hypothetical protein
MPGAPPKCIYRYALGDATTIIRSEVQTVNSTRRSLLVLLCALIVPASRAEAPRQLEWKDLVPKSTLDKPLPKLTRDQYFALTDIASVRERQAQADKTLSALDLSDERANTRKLEQQGIDVDGLLARRKELTEAKRAQMRAVNAALDGTVIRIPGYLLPLEYTGKDVTEFLLVPWVGACIHTPPPPPNQIVHVKSDKPVSVGSGLFAPVWVTGQLSTAGAKKSLYLMDGASEVDAGYSLHASKVEPYEQ